MRITSLISNLDIGGAESALCSLVEATHGKGVWHSVVSILPGGAFRPRIAAAGAEVRDINGRRGIHGGLGLRTVGRAIRDTRPDVVQAWMYHANIAASATAMLGYFDCPVLWGIRQSADVLDLDRRTTRILIRSGALLSRHPRAIVYNSEGATESHEQLGYAAAKRIIIPNGVDCERFQPHPAAREKLRAELSLPRDAILIGRVARYHSMKDFPTLIKAFASVMRAFPNARLVLVGPDVHDGNRDLMALCLDAGCAGNVHLLGPRLDTPDLYPALDVCVSSSVANEGFPNTVAEALASGSLVISTSVGEPKLIREGCHLVVAPGDPEQLATGIAALLKIHPTKRDELGNRGRNFILQHFDMRLCADMYCDLFRATIESATV